MVDTFRFLKADMRSSGWAMSESSARRCFGFAAAIDQWSRHDGYLCQNKAEEVSGAN
jgi:hypothetical protein